MSRRTRNNVFDFENIKSGLPPKRSHSSAYIFIETDESKRVQINGPFDGDTVIYVSAGNAHSVEVNGRGKTALGFWRALLALIADFASVASMFIKA